MTTYSIYTSNHKDAGKRIQTEESSKSWELRYDGPIATPEEARLCANQLAEWYKNVRVFKGKDIGKLWYGILRMN